MEYARLILYLALVLVLFWGCVACYRLYLHPLAAIPGPKLAALTRLCELYFDCVQLGNYCLKIEKWHKKYGSIIRIGPNEVHIDDPDWYDVLYNPSMKLDKDAWYYGIMGNHDSTFATVEYNVHRLKRNKQNPFFSRQNVDKSAPILIKVFNDMLAQFENHRVTGKPVNIRNAARSYATDVVSSFCFSTGTDFTTMPDFAQRFHNGLENFARAFPWFRHFPSIARRVFALPEWIGAYLDQESQAAVSFTQFVELQARESVRQSEANDPSPKKTIIRDMYESDLPERHRTEAVLTQEALALVAAGTFTTARLLECGIFHILQDPSIAAKLTSEVRAFKPDDKGPLTYRDLEGLPYLTAVVLECERMFPANRSRFPRINKTQDLFYQDYKLPRGTIVGMSAWDVLLSEKVWDKASIFDPSRWLDPASKKAMQKYMVPFSRGSRTCVGQNLAVAELYTVLGNFFRIFNAELYDTEIREIEVIADCFNTFTYKGSVGVRVLLT